MMLSLKERPTKASCSEPKKEIVQGFWDLSMEDAFFRLTIKERCVCTKVSLGSTSRIRYNGTETQMVFFQQMDDRFFLLTFDKKNILIRNFIDCFLRTDAAIKGFIMCGFAICDTNGTPVSTKFIYSRSGCSCRMD